MTLNTNDLEDPKQVEASGEHQSSEAANHVEPADSVEASDSEDSKDELEAKPEPSAKPAVAPAAMAKSKSGVSAKVIAAVLVVVVLGAGGLILQSSSSRSSTVKLTPHDMQVIFQELLPPQKQQQIASDPEEKNKLVADIKKLLAIAQVAEREGYAEHADIKSQITIQQEGALNEAYRKKNPDAKASDEEINAYYLAHPKDFDDYLLADPRAQQVQGPQRDELKKQLGEFKVIAERARKDKMDRDDVTRLRMIITRSQMLMSAYLGDLQKNADKLVTDADVEQYYNDHPADFDEVRLRHILISTQPKEDAEPEAGATDAKDKKAAEKPKTLTKDEARKKSQDLLDRIRKGEDFAKLAMENSDDTSSKVKGGLLEVNHSEYLMRGTLVPAFDQAAFALKPGEISDVVEVEYGFHIIKLEDRRAAANPSTDQKVHQKIVDKLKQEKLQARIDDITVHTDVVVPENFDTTPKVASQPQTSGLGSRHWAERLNRVFGPRSA
jgi:parvulin-like peptidyl-prolyl isomerase